MRSKVRKKSKEERRDGYLMAMIKSTWYTFTLIIFLFAGAVVFMGIEGNHQKFVGYRLLEEQLKFNKSLNKWLLSDIPRAVKLREDIKLSEKLETVEFDEIFSKQHQNNFSHILNFVRGRCSYVQNNLTSWNNKIWGDSYKYAVSIMSTVGWGVYFPPTTELRIVTLLYLTFGVPIFAAMINYISHFLDWLEKKLVTKKWVQKYLGEGTLSGFQVLFVIVVVLLFAAISAAFVEEEREEGLKALLFEAGLDDKWTFFVALYYTIQTVTTIGFGDIYIFAPKNTSLHVAPIMSVLLTAFIIAVFSRVFLKFQRKVEKSAEKKTIQARDSMISLHRGVGKAQQSVRKEFEEIAEESGTKPYKEINTVKEGNQKTSEEIF